MKNILLILLFGLFGCCQVPNIPSDPIDSDAGVPVEPVEPDCVHGYYPAIDNGYLVVRGNFKVSLLNSRDECQKSDTVYSCLVLRAGGYLWGDYTVEEVSLEQGFKPPCDGDISSIVSSN